jgi:hypothetical protein
MPPGGEVADRRSPCPALHAIWGEAAWARLSEAVNLGLGGRPEDIEFFPEAIRGEPGSVLTTVSRQPGDVLVIGAGRHGLSRLMCCRTARYCLAHSACPVVAVPPSQLAMDVHGLRGWVGRHRVHPEDADLNIAGA